MLYMFTSKNDQDKITKYDDYPYLCYIRVSSDKEEQETSPENQIDICRHWLEQNSFEWKEESVVFDDGISGTVLLDRPAMQLVLEKARKREIKMVVFKSIHRLARDLRDSLEIKETLIAHGVRLVTIEEGYDSLYEGKNDMKFEMFSMFAAQYPKTLSVSVSAAMGAKVRRGEHVGKVPFGYKLVDKKLEIDEKEAPTVRKIFKWYVEDGIGMKNITNMLNEEMRLGNVARPRKAKHWQLTSVQTILRNPTYAGVYIRNRYTKVKIDGRKKQIQNPPEKWQIFYDHHPAIIPLEVWEKANNQEITRKKTKITPWNEFRGLVKCGKCGSNIIILRSWKKKKNGEKTEWNYLKCSAYRRAGLYGCDNHVPITYEDFRSFIISRLKMKGQNIELNIKNNLAEKRQKELRRLETEKLSIEEKNKGLIDLYLEDKLISKKEFQEKRQEYERRLKEIENRIFILQQEKDNVDNIKNIVEAFKQLDNADLNLHNVFKTLIDHIVLHHDGRVEIYYNFLTPDLST